jgi:hypothetical protein
MTIRSLQSKAGCAELGPLLELLRSQFPKERIVMYGHVVKEAHIEMVVRLAPAPWPICGGACSFAIRLVAE